MLDIDNGARFETYAIEGERGQVCLNGAAARLVAPGDKVIIITYADYERAELDAYVAPRRARRRAQPGDRRDVGPPGRRAHADRTGVTTGARPGPFDVLVLGSGVAGLSAAVRLAGPGAPPSPSLVPRRADQGRAVPGGDALGPGRGRRGARGRRGLDRPAPRRHAGGRRRPLRRGGGAHLGRRGARTGARADRARRRVRPRGHRAAGPGPRGRPLPAAGRARRRRRHRSRGRAGPRRRHVPLGQRGARGVVRPRSAGGGRALRRGARPAARGR